MIGKYQLEISGEKLAMGMATSKYLQDGGLSPESYGVNPFVSPGVLKMIGGAADKSTNATGIMIASAEDSQSISSYNRLFVDDEGKYYSCDSSGNLTVRQTGAATTKYTPGFTDMISFNLNTYVTLTDNIAVWNTSAATFDEDWWTTVAGGGQAALNTGTPHPMLVYEGFHWIGDKDKLHKVTTGGTVTNGFLTLNSDERIQALGIDPGSGLMLISVQVTQNYSDTLSSKNFIYVFDGYSSKPRRKIPVDDLITAFYNVGGVVYVGYGTNVGYFNGSGISFLRKMSDVTYSGAVLLYKHKFGNWNQVLLVADGKNILAYGEAMQGKKAWFNVYQSADGSSRFQMVAHLGAGLIGASYTGDKFYVFSLTSTTAGAASLMTLITSNINFPRYVFIRRVVVITDGLTTAAGGVGNFAMIDENENVRQPPGTIGTFVVTAAQSPRYSFWFDFTSYKFLSGRARLNMDTQCGGVVRIVIFYDVAE